VLEKMIAITSDTDWAPVEVIEFMTSLLDSYGMTATFFCTDERGKAIRHHELAIHPFFKSVRAEKATLYRLLRAYPNAKGLRGHCGYFHTRLTDVCKELGLKYDSSYLIPGQMTEPFMLFNDVLEIPACFQDNHWFTRKTPFSPFLTRVVSGSGIPAVFNFHPIHVYLNTDCPQTYLKAKPYYQNATALLKFRRPLGTMGTRDLLIELLDLIRKKDLTTCTMRQINARFRIVKGK
jgi:hypothetical protein